MVETSDWKKTKNIFVLSIRLATDKYMATELFEPTEANHLTDGMYQTNLEGLLFSASQKHIDHRGYYAELVRLPELEEVLHKPFVPLQSIIRTHIKMWSEGFMRKIGTSWWQLSTATATVCW